MILATGVYTYDHLPQILLNRSEDQIAEIFVHDIENGIQGTDIKAAFIKCAADEPGVTPNVEKIHRAAARASQQTGRPIIGHSHPKSGTSLEQMRVFTEEGLDPRRSRWPTPATPTTSTTSSACSTPAAGSAWTATASTSTCRPSSARPRCSPSLRRATPMHVPLAGLLLTLDYFMPELEES